MNVRTRIVRLAAAAALSATVLGIGASAASAGDPSQWGRARAEVAGDPSQWGVEKVNEYEGQHR
jgi:hypothetical protein